MLKETRREEAVELARGPRTGVAVSNRACLRRR